MDTTLYKRSPPCRPLTTLSESISRNSLPQAAYPLWRIFLVCLAPVDGLTLPLPCSSLPHSAMTRREPSRWLEPWASCLPGRAPRFPTVPTCPWLPRTIPGMAALPSQCPPGAPSPSAGTNVHRPEEKSMCGGLGIV